MNCGVKWTYADHLAGDVELSGKTVTSRSSATIAANGPAPPKVEQSRVAAKYALGV